MDRNKYLEMCQKVSLLLDGLCGIKNKIPDELKVIYEEIVYYPLSYEMQFKLGNPINIAVLHDMKANSVIRAELRKVVEYGN